MALKTLKDVKEIGGFKIVQYYNADTMEEVENNFIDVDHKINRISFKIQDGPVGENGVNGCQVDTIIEAAKIILEGLNKQIYSSYTDEAIHCLEEALDLLNQRKKDREKRGVEGYNKP